MAVSRVVQVALQAVEVEPMEAQVALQAVEVELREAWVALQVVGVEPRVAWVSPSASPWAVEGVHSVVSDASSFPVRPWEEEHWVPLPVPPSSTTRKRVPSRPRDDTNIPPFDTDFHIDTVFDYIFAATDLLRQVVDDVCDTILH